MTTRMWSCLAVLLVVTVTVAGAQQQAPPPAAPPPSAPRAAPSSGPRASTVTVTLTDESGAPVQGAHGATVRSYGITHFDFAKMP